MHLCTNQHFGCILVVFRAEILKKLMAVEAGLENKTFAKYSVSNLKISFFYY